jgi:hypothetical protein
VILDVLTAEIATGVPARTIRRWALLGRIIDHGDGFTIRVDVDEVTQLRDMRDARPGHRLPRIGGMA